MKRAKTIVSLTGLGQKAWDEALRARAGQRVRLQIIGNGTVLEYVGRVPRRSETRPWPAARAFGDACLLSRPGSADPANPISPQVHYLRLIDGEWCVVRLRIQDLEPLEIRRLGPGEIEVDVGSVE